MPYSVVGVDALAVASVVWDMVPERCTVRFLQLRITEEPVPGLRDSTKFRIIFGPLMRGRNTNDPNHG